MEGEVDGTGVTEVTEVTEVGNFPDDNWVGSTSGRAGKDLVTKCEHLGKIASLECWS